MAVDDIDFPFFADFLLKTSGYNLQPEKKYLLESRLGDVLKVHKLADEKALAGLLKQDPHSDIAGDVIEAMTVNETFFFRDQSPFETFEQKILPKLADWNEPRPFRIWSAACSTGQEPYSLAMVIEDNHHKYPKVSYEIVATDINNRVLAQARHGLYTDLEVHRGLPDNYREKYLQRDGSNWKVADNVKRHISFRQLNLQGKYDIPGSFDLVFLRNVLIYFNEPMKEYALTNVARKMNPNAYLLLGAAEGIYDPEHFFQRCDEIKGLYRCTKVV